VLKVQLFFMEEVSGIIYLLVKIFMISRLSTEVFYPQHIHLQCNIVM